MDATEQFLTQLETAKKHSTYLCIQGGQSKPFPATHLDGEILSTKQHQGIIQYEPTELVITARSGTSLQTLEAILAEHDQRLPFEPPHFGPATLGGTIACNLSGPARAYSGAARDYVLGIKMINGKGHVLNFGGRVMKNVAGYDLSRLQCGARGTFGLLLEISLKVLPTFRQEQTFSLVCDVKQAIDHMNQWAGLPIPLSATFFDGERLWIRLSGHEEAITAALKQLPSHLEVTSDNAIWPSVREQTSEHFQFQHTLWRVSIPSRTPPAPEPTYLEWNGALRWVADPQDLATLKHWVKKHKGSMVLYKAVDDDPGPVIELSPSLFQLSVNLKNAFDPDHIWNPNVCYTAEKN